jgi:uncharacterized FAD-dependent dehydrogenase
MIRVPNLKVPLGQGEQQALALALRRLGISQGQVSSWRVSRKSVDARDKRNIQFVYTLDIELYRQ